MILVAYKQENIFPLKKVLEIHDFDVDTASSGKEALNKILKQEYALSIVDAELPGMDDSEVAEAISGYSKAKDIPIIFLTEGNTHKKLITKGYVSGGMDYITKPVDPEILLLKVKTFYKLYKQSRELARIREALGAEIESRKEAEMKREEFLSLASHELKTPLTTIKAYLQLSERSIANGRTELTQQYIGRTQTQLERLNRLVSDLLDISKIESGQLKFNKTRFNFEQILNGAMDIIKQTHDDVNITLTGSPDVELFGDEARIEQVLVKYLANAFKYSPGSKDVHIDVSVTPKNLLLVKVKDFGIGIPSEKQTDIFEKFYRVEETSQRFQGLGIGLYICAEILKRHNGAYGVESKLGEGSTFYFSLQTSN